MKRKKSLYIKDMISAMEKIDEFTTNITFEDLPPLKPKLNEVLEKLLEEEK